MGFHLFLLVFITNRRMSGQSENAADYILNRFYKRPFLNLEGGKALPPIVAKIALTSPELMESDNARKVHLQLENCQTENC